MTETLRAADVLARRLYAAGCRFAFGMPGGEVLTLVDALEKAGIRFVLVKHENAAGFMAEGAWHRTGAPGILVATLGPGALNGINSVENARQDRVPLIVLTGCVDADLAQTYTHQVLDQPQIFRPITKDSLTLVAGAAGVIADKAVGIATEGRPGPVHIDVPISVANAKAEETGVMRAVTTKMQPNVADLIAMRDALATAQHPVLVVGLDAVNAEAGAEVLKTAELLGAPVITTYKAKGIIPETHPLSLGGAGLSPRADGILLPLIAQADVVLAVGYDPIEMRAGWQNPWNPVRQTVIDITAEPNHHYMHHASHALLGDPNACLSALTEGVEPCQTWADGEPAAIKTALTNAFAPQEEWGPSKAMTILRDALPQDVLASADSGAHRILLSQIWTCEEPRALVQSSGLCTMGCAIPLAMGMEIADPGQRCVSFSGDAGFLMAAGELATAAELGLRTIFVVFVDASLALIEMKQRQRQLPNAGVDFGHHDFAAIGRAFGGQGFTARTEEQLRAAVMDSLKEDVFSVIAVEIPKGSYDGMF